MGSPFEKMPTLGEGDKKSEGLTEGEKKELDTLDNDPEAKELERLNNIFRVLEEGGPKVAVKNLEEFKAQHPEAEKKLKRIKELEKKAAGSARFIPSGM